MEAAAICNRLEEVRDRLDLLAKWSDASFRNQSAVRDDLVKQLAITETANVARHRELMAAMNRLTDAIVALTPKK